MLELCPSASVAFPTPADLIPPKPKRRGRGRPPQNGERAQAAAAKQNFYRLRKKDADERAVIVKELVKDSRDRQPVPIAFKTTEKGIRSKIERCEEERARREKFEKELSALPLEELRTYCRVCFEIRDNEGVYETTRTKKGKLREVIREASYGDGADLERLVTKQEHREYGGLVLPSGAGPDTRISGLIAKRRKGEQGPRFVKI